MYKIYVYYHVDGQADLRFITLYEVYFLIQGVSIKYADEIFRYIQDKLTENKSLDPSLAF